MRILSLKQPWASLIVNGYKDVENRTWKTPYRGKILIHASSGKVPMAWIPEDIWSLLETLAQDEIIESYKKLPQSAIVGYVTLEDIVTDSESEWAEDGCYHWVLKDAYAFDKPITGVNGKLNLWNYDIDENNLPPAHRIDSEEVADEEKENYLLDRLSLYEVDPAVLTKKEMEWVRNELFSNVKVADKESFFHIGNISKIHARMARRNPAPEPVERRKITRIQKGKDFPTLFDIGVKKGDIITSVKDDYFCYTVNRWANLVDEIEMEYDFQEAMEEVLSASGYPDCYDIWEEWTCNGILLSDLYDKWAEKKESGK